MDKSDGSPRLKKYSWGQIFLLTGFFKERKTELSR